MLYNPQMKGAYNFVPGVMGMILMLICAMMTSISIAREKELGTMEVLLVSPMKPIYIILSKTIPYFVLSLVNLATILLLSVFLLKVPIAGSLFWLIAFSLVYIFVNLSLGCDFFDSRLATGGSAYLGNGAYVTGHYAIRNDVSGRKYAGFLSMDFANYPREMVYYRGQKNHD